MDFEAKARQIVARMYQIRDDKEAVRVIDAELRQAYHEGAAEGRRNAIEKSAELIGRQVEPRDA